MKIDKLIRLLEKRAKGFTYEEVQEEFLVKTENAELNKKNETNDKNLFNIARQTKAFEPNDENFFGRVEDHDENRVIESQTKRKRGRPKKNENSNAEKKSEKPNSAMSLVKRKVHTFYVPPDMIAIKMLIEIEGKPSSQSDDVFELAEKRRVLLEEIRKELLGEDSYED